MPKRSKSAKSSPASSLAGISTEDARRYRAEEAMRTLQRAEEHRKDKGLMSEVRKLAKQHVASLSKVCK